MADVIRAAAGWVERLRGAGQGGTTFARAGVRGLMSAAFAPLMVCHGKPRIARHAIDCTRGCDAAPRLLWCWSCTGPALCAGRVIEHTGYGDTPAEAYRQWRMVFAAPVATAAGEG